MALASALIVVSGVRYDDTAASVSDDDGIGRGRDQLALGMVVDVEGGAVTTAADGGPPGHAKWHRARE